MSPSGFRYPPAVGQEADFCIYSRRWRVPNPKEMALNVELASALSNSVKLYSKFSESKIRIDKMNIRVSIMMIIGLILLSCEKEKNSGKIDYRNEIVGDYIGIKVYTSWITNVGWDKDTSEIVITLSKSKSDSIVDIDFNPDYYSSTQFSFKYKDGQFKATTYYHPPTLSVSSDSLYFFHQPGLGPIWTECFAIKDE